MRSVREIVRVKAASAMASSRKNLASIVPPDVFQADMLLMILSS